MADNRRRGLFINREEKTASLDMIDVWNVAVTMWEFSGIAVQLNINCSYWVWK